MTVIPQNIPVTRTERTLLGEFAHRDEVIEQAAALKRELEKASLSEALEAERDALKDKLSLLAGALGTIKGRNAETKQRLWHECLDLGNKLIQESMRAYDNWTMEMLALYNQIFAMAQALAAEVDFGKLLSILFTAGKQLYLQQELQALENQKHRLPTQSLATLMDARKQRQAKLSDLHIDIEFKDGKIHIPFAELDHAAPQAEQEKKQLLNQFLVKAGALVIAWLGSHDFRCEADGAIRTNKIPNSWQDYSSFISKTINHDKAGLKAFLEERFKDAAFDMEAKIHVHVKQGPKR